MKYLLDTNTIIYILQNEPSIVRDTLYKKLQDGIDIYTSSIVLGELYYGINKSNKKEMNLKKLNTLLSANIKIIDFSNEDANIKGKLRYSLEIEGIKLQAYDLLIIAQSIRMNSILVTHDKLLKTIKDVKYEDWYV